MAVTPSAFGTPVPLVPLLLCLGYGCSFLAHHQAGEGAVAAAPFAAVALWGTGTALVWAALDRPDAASREPSWSVAEKVGVATLFAIALAVRIVGNEHVPAELSGDEGSSGLSAVDVLEGRLTNPFVCGWFSFPALFNFLQAGMIGALGRDYGAIRDLSALAGSLTVVGLYWWARALAGTGVAVVSAALLTTQHLHVHFSRLALNNVWDGLFAVFTLGFLWRGFEHGSRRHMLAAGVSIGASQYFYPGARVLPLATAAFAAWALLFEREKIVSRLGDWLALVLAAVVVFLPIGIYFLHHPGEYFAPVHRVSLLYPRWGPQHDLTWFEDLRNVTGRPIWMLFLDNLRSAFLGFVTEPLRSFYRPGRPLLSTLPALLAGVGFLRLLVNHRDPRAVLLFIVLGGVISVVALTESTPASQRYVLAAPVAVLIAALGAGELLRHVPKVMPVLSRVARPILFLVVVIAMLDDSTFYFSRFAPGEGRGDHKARITSRLGSHLAGAPSGRLYFLATPAIPGARVFSTLPFLAPRLDLLDVHGLAREVPAWPRGGRATFVFLPGREGEITGVMERFPGGRVRRFFDDDVGFLFALYEIDGEGRSAGGDDRGTRGVDVPEPTSRSGSRGS